MHSALGPPSPGQTRITEPSGGGFPNKTARTVCVHLLAGFIFSDCLSVGLTCHDDFELGDKESLC